MPTAERYNQYQLLRREDGSLWELGRGAMGITFKAYDTNLRFPVALKVINSAYLESDTARQRFLREARAAAALRHPNVAQVFNLGTEQDKYYYVMEFIDGETVEARVKRLGPLSPAEALNIALQVTRALAVAAKQQLVHRDLKPTNLMLVDQEGEQIVKVIDFGLAKVARETGEDSAALTVAGFVGTPHFASPEQIEEGEVDIRSDIYSLGVTLYFGLTSQSPFSGSIGQVMSQQLYKPLPIGPIAHLPGCVVSLLQHMMEKDPKSRPQTPQDLQKVILACLEEIRQSPSQAGYQATVPPDAFDTLDLRVASSQPPAVGAVLAKNYKLIEELGESPEGRSFLAEDLRRQRRVCVLLLSPEFLSDRARVAGLEESVRLLRNAPHPMLREIYSLETVTDSTFLVEEHVAGTSMLDILRTRSVLTAPEVVRLVNLLAPLADHANLHRLQYVDMTLSGIHLTDRFPSGTQPEVLRRPLTAWEPFEAKVDAINFSLSPSQSEIWASPATRTQGAPLSGPPGSCVRSLSLLAYELLGGPRTRLETTGQYSPIAALTQEGNRVLRRAVVDECPSAGEFARQLAAAASITKSASNASGMTKPAPVASKSAKHVPRTSDSRTPPPQAPVAPQAPVEILDRPRHLANRWRLVLILCFAALLVTGSYVVSWYLRNQEIPSLSIHTDPADAALFLDGKPPDVFPNTFLHVGFGTHQLKAVLSSHEIIKQEIQVRRGMGPEIRLQLQPNQELPALAVITEPAGASILLDGKPPQAPKNTFTHVPVGSHQITATLDDYEPIKQEIQVRPGMAPQVRLQLKPVQEIGALSVTTDPTGASILLDGKPPQAPPNTFTHVPFGTHQLSATLEDYEPIKQDIQVRKGMAPQIHLQLRPLQEIPALSVTTEPAGASILLDGQPPQVPPDTFTHVPFGSHQITATLEDYEPVKQDIQVRKGTTPQIRLQLKSVQEIPLLSVTTEPAGASILLDGQSPQVPPDTFTHVSFGTHQITVTLEDYEPVKQEIQVRKGTARQIRLQLKPVQELAALSVATDPAGASILLDGKPPQAPSNTFTHIPFGPHQLTATLEDYEPIKQEVLIRRGMAPQIRLQLKPVQEIPSLSITGEPAGASIFLDGQPPQVPPDTFTHVSFGTHQITATLEDYEPVKQEIQIRKGMARQIRLQLKPVQELAALSVATDPAGASILLDGKPPQAPSNTFTHVPFGPHQLTAALEDFEPLKQEINVQKGMAAHIRLQLKPIPEIAALSVETDPPGATILLDGKSPESPPNTFTHVSFGAHQITATLDDYEPVKQDIQVRKGMDPEVHLQLKPDSIAGLKREIKKFPEGSPEQITAYVRLIQLLAASSSPEAGDYTKELTRILEELRARNPPVSRKDFTLSYKDSIKDAVDLDILPAILWLAENEKPAEAAVLFLRGAQKGDSYAMMKLGRLHLRKGIEAEDAEGFRWLNQAYAAPKPNLEAGAYIGDCYLIGKGTRQDLQKSEEIVIPLANRGVVAAMTVAGKILQYKADSKEGEAQASSSPEVKRRLEAEANKLDRQARKWWEQAEKNDWNASARLGKCYEEGWGGVERNEAEAEKRYKAGSENGNALSMFFYGLFLEKRPERKSEAETLIARAASIGLPSAEKWCNEHNVRISETRPDEERQ